jgi:hypothetical protein
MTLKSKQTDSNMERSLWSWKCIFYNRNSKNISDYKNILNYKNYVKIITKVYYTL